MAKTRDFFKKIRDREGTFHAKVGTIKDRNDMDLTESEDIKKMLKEYIELYKKDMKDPDNHDGVITHLELDILKCTSSGPSEVSLGIKQVEVMEFQLSYFKSSKMTLLNCCTQYASKFGIISSGHRTGNVIFISIQKNGHFRECSSPTQ